MTTTGVVDHDFLALEHGNMSLFSFSQSVECVTAEKFMQCLNFKARAAC